MAAWARLGRVWIYTSPRDPSRVTLDDISCRDSEREGDGGREVQG